MYDLNDLERKWVSYKKQKYKKIFSLGAAFAAVSALSFGAAYLLFAGKNQDNANKTQSAAAVTDQNSTPKQSIAQNNNEVVELTLAGEKPMSLQKEIVIISPEQRGESEFKSFAPADQGRQQTLEQQEQQRQPQPSVALQPQYQSQLPQTTQKPPKIQIETKSADLTQLLEERFAKNGTIDTALTLSDEYYKKGDYQKALKWAINANSIDAKNEKSWILFAKSSYKLGRKQDAINALENYAKTSGSDAAKSLLRQLRAGEI